jgi:phosphatidate phosphatase PAH1
MGLLQYTSNEMFSSTELVRKSKNIFDKLNKNEIEKAIILRDGKPGIILLDFNQYENIMNDYLKLKDKSLNQYVKKENIESRKQNDVKINSDEYQHALEEIDKLEFSFDSNSAKEDKIEPLKEFWD